MKATEVEIAWATGFIEGEGGAYIDRYHERHFGRSPHPRIYAANSDPSTIKPLKQLFGGSIWTKAPHTSKRGVFQKKTMYYWGIASRLAYKAAKMMLPYVHSKKKREQIQSIVDFYDKKDRIACQSA